MFYENTSTYWFEIVGEDSDLCGEEFFTELEDAEKGDHIAYAHEIFPNEKIRCLGPVTAFEAEIMGFATYWVQHSIFSSLSGTV